MTIAFDVDGTLVTYQHEPRWDVLTMLRLLSKTNTIIVWSGGGKDYSEMWVRKLHIEKYISSCHTKPIRDIKQNYFYDGKEGSIEKPDVCFDDELVDLAKVNIKI